MTDYQRIIDDLRSSLYVTGPEAADAVRAATADYAVACDEVNQRLRRCGELLKAGLRTEALQQCEIEPNLLDVVATLDFPEREYWTQRCGQLGISVPAPLLIDVAAELNEAYAIEQPLESLLAKHRLLNLSHSPLKLRVRTLRKLAEVDANNPIWQEDLLAFEPARFKEIQDEASRALTTRDVARILKLEKELITEKWLSTPPTSLVQTVIETRYKLTTSDAKRELEKLEKALNDAYAAFDLQQAQALRDRWNEVAPVSGLKESDPIWQRAAPALEWVAIEDDKQQRRQEHLSAVAALERALDEDKPLGILDRWHHAAVKQDHELPPVLKSRYEARVADLRLAVGRRRRLLTVAAAAVSLVIVGVVVWFVRGQVHANKVSEHTAALTKMLDENRISAAQQYVGQLHKETPHFLTESPIASLVARLDGVVQQQTDRQKAFQIALQTATTAMEEAKDMPSLGQARKHTTAAQQLAQSDAEKADVQRILARVNALDREFQSAENQLFSKDVQSFLAQVESVAISSQPDDRRLAEISRIRHAIDARYQNSSNINPLLREQLKPLKERLTGMEQEIGTRRQMDRSLEDIDRSVRDAEQFAKALQDYATKYPASTRSSELQRAASELELWNGLSAYDNLATNWKRYNHQSVDPKTAKELIQAANQVLKDHGAYPDALAYRERVPYLEAVAGRVDGDGQPIDAKLRAQFNKPWMSDLWMAESNKGVRYYFRIKPSLPEQQATMVKYVADFDLAEKSIALKKADVVSLDRAPQAVLAGKALELFRHLDGNGQAQWERYFTDLMSLFIVDPENSHATDPLLRAILLQEVLETACKGSKCLDLAFKQHRTHLDDSSLNVFANWLDPESADVVVARNRAESALRELPEFNAARKRAGELWTELSRPVGKNYRWVGWLARNDQGQWECRAARNLGSQQSGELAVVLQDLKGQVRTEKVGQIRQGKTAMLTDIPSAALLEGRPVFIVE